MSTQGSFPGGIFFKTDGKKMYEVASDDKIWEYDLSTAWDISTASVNQSIPKQDSILTGAFFPM